MKNAIKVFCFVLAVLVIGIGGTYFFFTWDKGEFIYADGSDRNTVIITGYKGSEKDIEIPNTLRGKKVISIDQNAFMESDIKSVKIGSNIKTVGNDAFQSCKNLKTVEICEGVRSIGNTAFLDCEKLESVIIPSTLEKIGDAPFLHTKLKDIDFSNNGYFIIENGVIYNKDKTELVMALSSADLSSFVCPETVTSIKSLAFSDHKELKSFKLNDGIKIINPGVFNNCTSLSEISVPKTVVSVSGFAFGNSGLKKIYIPAETSKFEKGVFFGIEKNLTVVTPKNSPAEIYAKENNIKVENS